MIKLTSQQVERLKRLVSKPFQTVTDIEQNEHSLKFYIKHDVLLFMVHPTSNSGLTSSRQEVVRYILENLDEVDTRSVISWLESERQDLIKEHIQRETRNIYSTGVDEMKKRINLALEKVLDHLTIREVNELKKQVFVRVEIETQWSDSYLDALSHDIKLCKEERDKILNKENELKLRIMFDIDSLNDRSIRYAAYAQRRNIGEDTESIPEFEEIYEDERYERINYLDQLYDLVSDELDLKPQIEDILSRMQVRNRIYNEGIGIDDQLIDNVIVFTIFTFDPFDLDKFEQNVYELYSVTNVNVVAYQKDLSVDAMLKRLGFY